MLEPRSTVFAVDCTGGPLYISHARLPTHFSFSKYLLCVLFCSVLAPRFICYRIFPGYLITYKIAAES